jgi:uncharacterized protein (TIGR00156 family)
MQYWRFWNPFMKKILIALVMVGATTTAVAQYTGPVARQASTVQQVLAKAVDDQYVTLKGYLVGRLSHDKYMFKDGSGQIQVEIPERLFPLGINVDASTLVEIAGEYDKEHFGTPEIEVKQLVVG